MAEVADDLKMITPRELSDLARKWYETGELSFLEHCLVSMPAEVLSGGDDAMDVPFDLIAYFKRVSQTSRDRGDPANRQELNQRVVEFLQARV